mgnify:CR=1 FL=1
MPDTKAAVAFLKQEYGSFYSHSQTYQDGSHGTVIYTTKDIEFRRYQPAGPYTSHGAGRQYSRKGAMAAFSCEEVILDLQKQGVILGKRERRRGGGEPVAYKNIEEVMDNQQDLVVPVKRL